MQQKQSERVIDDYPSRQLITTRWAHQDAYGHVNNVIYFSYVDTAVNSYLMEATGLDTRELETIGVVAEAQCKFGRELHYPGDVVVGIGVTRVGNSSISYELGIFQEEEQAPAAVAKFVHVYVDRTTRKSSPIPDPIREVVEKLVLQRSRKSHEIQSRTTK